MFRVTNLCQKPWFNFIWLITLSILFKSFNPRKATRDTQPIWEGMCNCFKTWPFHYFNGAFRDLDLCSLYFSPNPNSNQTLIQGHHGDLVRGTALNYCDGTLAQTRKRNDWSDYWCGCVCVCDQKLVLLTVGISTRGIPKAVWLQVSIPITKEHSRAHRTNSLTIILAKCRNNNHHYVHWS